MSRMLDYPYVEIDSLYHGPNWTPRPEFVENVEEFIRGSRWITEWQYTIVRTLLAARADTVVWLDHPAALTLARITQRTVRRSRSRDSLWNGNVEAPLRSFFYDRDNIIRWAMRTQRTYKRSVPALATGHPQLQIVRLRNQRQVERWLTGPLRKATR
jgi:adenylate kinase family enzyme